MPSWGQLRSDPPTSSRSQSSSPSTQEGRLTKKNSPGKVMVQKAEQSAAG